MKRMFVVYLILLLSLCSACAHEHWISAVATQKNDGLIAKLTICSGHSFPKSDSLPTERFLSGLQVKHPDGSVVPFEVTALEQVWTAEVKLKQPGVWLFSFAMQRPRQSSPIYFARAILVTEGRDDVSLYALKEGLEIVPGASLSELKSGNVLPLVLMRDGVVVDGRIGVNAENGGSFFLSTVRGRPAQLKIKASGGYLLTAAEGGQTVSLMFSVSSDEGGKR